MRTRLALAAALLLALPACGGSTDGGSERPERAAATEREPDASAFVACRHFRNVMGDLDVLTAEEIRGKVKEVHDKARVSDEAGIPESSRAMLAAATGDDGEGFLQAVGEMSAACGELGL